MFPFQKKLVRRHEQQARRDVRREMNELAASQNPDFVIFTGDFINTALDEQQWDDWFDDWHELMITMKQ